MLFVHKYSCAFDPFIVSVWAYTNIRLKQSVSPFIELSDYVPSDMKLML